MQQKRSPHRKRVAVLGSTGSIGTSALDVIATHPGRLELAALAAHSNIEKLEEQCRRFAPRGIAVWDAAAAQALSKRLGAPVPSGDEGLVSLAVRPDVDVVVIATSRSSALSPLMEAIKAGKQIALASKELLVMAGSLLMEMAARHNATIMPVDSEHAALFQCLKGVDRAEVRRLTVTGSGGPLWKLSAEEMRHATVEQVLNHPKWSMGRKITVDSATLMNKGLEIIEARWLFGYALEQLQVVIHPEAAVHALIEMRDGTLLAQMSACDMRLPIQAALSYPERWESTVEPVDLKDLSGLHFHEPDLERFPCLALAWEAARAGQSLCAVMNGANDTAVEAYLEGHIPFTDIPVIIREIMSRHEPVNDPTLEAILEYDGWARETAKEFIAQCSKS